MKADFLQLWMELTRSAMSPDLFRQWTGISLVAGALERRVWAKVGVRQTYPNLFVLLVAPPGVGKSIIEEVHNIWQEVKKPGENRTAFHVAPTSMTKASLVDEIGKTLTRRLPVSGPPVEYSAMLIAAEEFPVLMPSYDMEYMGTLNYIYNNPTSHKESRRTGTVKEITITNPQLNLLAGVQPGWLSTVFPEEAWTTGFTSRTIMVYAAEREYKDIFSEEGFSPEIRAEVLGRLSELSTFFGEYNFSEPAVARLRAWLIDGCKPEPTHSKLDNYNRRRNIHLIKLSLVSAAMRGSRSEITLSDVERAMAWMFEAESLMPDIFRAMVGRSDHQVMEELHSYLSSLYRMGGNKPIHENQIWNFLKTRVPSEKIEKIVQVAERSNVIEREAGTSLYKPRPRYDHIGME